MKASAVKSNLECSAALNIYFRTSDMISNVSMCGITSDAIRYSLMPDVTSKSHPMFMFMTFLGVSSQMTSDPLREIMNRTELWELRPSILMRN